MTAVGVGVAGCSLRAADGYATQPATPATPGRQMTGRGAESSGTFT
jgi:hypothetical protein